jgi:hypothetical protein
MQEIEVCEKNYIDLINKIKAKRTKQLIDEFLEMRLDISKRIEELEDYFDENFGNIRMNILEKGIFQLKKLLFYNPDKNNDLEDSDLKEFRGLTIDLNQIEENFPFKNYTKNNMKKNINKNSKLNNKNKKKENEDKNNDEDDLIKNLPIKRKIQVRLTDEEYELLQKLRAKKLNTTTTVK